MSLLDQIRQALAELELVSHAPIQGYDLAPPEGAHRSRWRLSDKNPPVAHAGSHGAKGGDTKVPLGSDADERPVGPDEKAAFRASYHSRTVGYYRERLRSRGPSEALLADVRETVQAWRVLRIPAGQPPALGDPQWKRYVAESAQSNAELARLYGKSREYIRQVRRDYGL